MKNIFVPTQTYTRLREAVTACLERPSGMEFVVGAGRSGTGKTTAVDQIAIDDERVEKLRALTNQSPVGLLKAATYSLTGQSVNTQERCYKALEEQAKTQIKGVIIDEANMLSTRHLQTMRDLHDVYGFPVILIGEPGLAGKIRSMECFDRRKRREIDFSEVIQRDVKVFFNMALGVKLTPDQCAKVHTKAKTIGLVKKAAQQVEGLMLANGIEGDTVSDAIIKGALANV